MASCDSARRRLTSGNNNLIGQFERMRHLGLEPKLPGNTSIQKTWNQLREEALGADALPAAEEDAALEGDSEPIPDL